jgi:hypothetical protein
MTDNVIEMAARAEQNRERAQATEVTTVDAGEAMLADALAEMNAEYCVVRVKGKTRVLWFEREADRWITCYASFQDFTNYHCNRKVLINDEQGRTKSVPLAPFWLNYAKRPTYRGVTFQPNEGPVVNGKINLWRGWGIEPAPGKWPLMRAHIREVIAAGNDQFDRYVVGWMANMFQNPGRRAGVAVILVSPQEGVGKGAWATALVRILGQHGLQISNRKHLTGDFNAHFQDLILLFGDEPFWPGDKSAHGILNQMISEPFLFIEPKGIDGYQMPNCLHIIMASNHEWVVPARLSARRYAVNEASNAHMGDKAYFKALYNEMDNGGLAAMLYDLLRYDLSNFDVLDFPRTQALKEQKIQSLEPFDQWWLNLLENGRLPGALHSNPRRAYTSSLLWHAKETVPGLKFMSDILLGRMLSNQGCKGFKLQGRGWEFPPLVEARQAWEMKAGKWNWNPNEVADQAVPDEDWEKLPEAF